MPVPGLSTASLVGYTKEKLENKGIPYPQLVFLGDWWPTSPFISPRTPKSFWFCTESRCFSEKEKWWLFFSMSRFENLAPGQKIVWHTGRFVPGNQPVNLDKWPFPYKSCFFFGTSLVWLWWCPRSPALMLQGSHSNRRGFLDGGRNCNRSKFTKWPVAHSYRVPNAEFQCGFTLCINVTFRPLANYLNFYLFIHLFIWRFLDVSSTLCSLYLCRPWEAVICPWAGEMAHSQKSERSPLCQVFSFLHQTGFLWFT